MRKYGGWSIPSAIGSQVSSCLLDSRIQPWSTYAVFQTTLTHWSFLWDCLLVYMYFWTTASWNYESRELGFVGLAVWIFFFGKFIKTLGHYCRYPVDFLLLPLSIGFGYLHGFVKLHGLFSINVVSWTHVSRSETFHKRMAGGFSCRWRRFTYLASTNGTCRPHGVAAKEPTATMRIAWFVSPKSRKSTSTQQPKQYAPFDDFTKSWDHDCPPTACLIHPSI